jgi:hypothetical protein
LTSHSDIDNMASNEQPQSPDSPIAHSTKLSISEMDCVDCSDEDEVETESDWEDGSDASDRESSRTNCLSPVLDSTIELIVDRLMAEVRTLVDQPSPSFRCAGSDTPSSQSSPPRPQGLVSGQDWSCGSKRTRKQDLNDSQGNSGDNSDGEVPSKKQKASSAEAEKSRKFACPYYKRDPLMTTNHRSCAGPGWDTVHRVKYDFDSSLDPASPHARHLGRQCAEYRSLLLTLCSREHLHRRHALPIRCERCCVTFRTDLELSSHLRQPQACEVREGPLLCGFNKEQERQLRSRRKTGLDEAGKWKEVYKILFPDDDEALMPSPCGFSFDSLEREPQSLTCLLDYILEGPASLELIRSEEVLRIEQFSRRELPRLVRAELERRILGSMSPVENELRSRLVEIVRDCQSLLFRQYNHHEPGESSGSNPPAIIQDVGSRESSGTVRGADFMGGVAPFLQPPPVSDDVFPMSTMAVTANYRDCTPEFGGGPTASHRSQVDSAYASMTRSHTSQEQTQEPCGSADSESEIGGAAAAERAEGQDGATTLLGMSGQHVAGPFDAFPWCDVSGLDISNTHRIDWDRFLEE